MMLFSETEASQVSRSRGFDLDLGALVISCTVCLRVMCSQMLQHVLWVV